MNSNGFLRRVFTWLCAFAIVGLLTVLTGGCTHLAGTPGSPEWNTTLQAQQTEVRVLAALTTTAATLGMEPKEEASFGRLAYRVSSAVNTLASDSTTPINLAEIRVFVTQELASSSLHDKVKVATLINSLATLVQSKLDQNYSTATPGTKSLITKSLIRGVSAGVMDATQMFAPPATQPTTRAAVYVPREQFIVHERRI